MPAIPPRATWNTLGLCDMGTLAYTQSAAVLPLSMS